MLYLVLYDITANKARKKVADHLLNQGLTRAQFSVFIGTLAKNRADELALYAESLLAETDRLYIIPVQRDALSTARMVGRGIDVSLVSDELLTMVM
jgi:CRISPR-associated endonuclease Cas2